jgi:glucose/arabinose dehydrogenase
MTRISYTILLFVNIIFTSGCSAEPPEITEHRGVVPEIAGRDIYVNYCIGCHGRDLRGGTASNLVASQLKYGNDRANIYKSTALGIKDMGMPAYGDALTTMQLSQLTDYITHVRQGGSINIAENEKTRPVFRANQRRTISTLDYQVNVDVFVDGLDKPWGLNFIDENRALITEQRGTLRLVVNGILQREPIAGTPEVYYFGQGGLMDVAPDPDYNTNGWIYLVYSHTIGNRLGMTRVVRGKISNNTWQDEQVLFEADANMYRRPGVHFGSRIVFDSEKRLYFAIGDRGVQDEAQDLRLPNGKIHRINRDGSIPNDNPFINTSGAMSSIFSYGHRNPQGLSFHPITGELWDVEHGPRGGDEVNICHSGLNYGWPLISYGINYSGTIFTRERKRPGLEQPVLFWRPSIAVCAAEFYTGSEFPYWQNHLLVTALAYQELRLLTVEDDRVIHQEILLKNYGRVRDVANGPDGAIYVVMNDPHQVLRLSKEREQLR